MTIPSAVQAQPAKSNESPSPRSDSRYYDEARTWEHDIARRNRNSRAIAWIIASVMTILAGQRFWRSSCSCRSNPTSPIWSSSTRRRASSRSNAQWPRASSIRMRRSRPSTSSATSGCARPMTQGAEGELRDCSAPGDRRCRARTDGDLFAGKPQQPDQGPRSQYGCRGDDQIRDLPQ